MWELTDELQEEVTILIHALQENQGYEDAKSAYTVWFGEDDPRNVTARTRGKTVTKEAGECQAALYALAQVPSNDKLTLKTSSGYPRRILTVNLKKMEERDWLGNPNAEILQALTATLRARSGPTLLGKLNERCTIAHLKGLVVNGLS